jgi:hypothetical protein
MQFWFRIRGYRYDEDGFFSIKNCAAIIEVELYDSSYNKIPININNIIETTNLMV